MKKIAVMVSALVLCVALGAATLATGATTKVSSKVTLKFSNGGSYTPYGQYGQDTFSGKVKAKKGCKKSRSVKITGTNLAAKTNSKGKYSVSTGNIAAGTYGAKVAKKKIKKANGKKIVCKKAKSAPVTVSS